MTDGPRIGYMVRMYHRYIGVPLAFNKPKCQMSHRTQACDADYDSTIPTVGTTIILLHNAKPKKSKPRDAITSPNNHGTCTQ
jgi:hypothetical protein